MNSLNKFHVAAVLGVLFISAPATAGQLGAARHAAASSPCPKGARDADNDGLCDRLERATGTDPYDADTDNDSVPDGEEDLDGDGRVGPGESDPRSPGLFPGSAPHIPEPLVFDLVRGLGAKQGEFEVNALLLTTFRRGNRPRVEWAPEVEWALLDGFAVELELPMEGTEIVALKSALQVTLPGGDAGFTHGLQGIGEHEVHEGTTESSLLYLMGVRSAAWSVLTMLGGRYSMGDNAAPAKFLLNPSIFYDVAEQLTLGMETNFAASMGEREWLLVPQVHYQISQRLRLQAGGGLHIVDGQSAPVLTTRAIVE